MDLGRYFDHAATTPLDPRVRAEMAPFVEGVGNAHSLHSFGRFAADAVRLARERLAEAIGAEDPDEIVFTSGATEANAWVLRDHPRPYASPFEHSSVAAAADGFLGNEGYLLASPPPEAGLVAVMGVNNETGAILAPPLDLPSPLLRDFTQSLGKTPFSLDGADFASFSAHKIGGPMGVGALWIRPGRELAPWTRGGDQERALRSGTLNVPGIVGFGLAAHLAAEEADARRALAAACRAAVLGELADLPGWRTLDGPAQSPFILALAFDGLEAQPLLEALDAEGWAVGSGSACSSHRREPSRVVAALGYADPETTGVLRVSFGATSTPEASRRLGRAILRGALALAQLRTAT